MGDVIPFKSLSKRKTVWEKHKGSSLCRDGFHKWIVVTERKFDVKQGRLVTEYRCQRCGKNKIELL